MPPTTIQSRISAFEASSSSFTTTTRSPRRSKPISPSPPLARKTSLLDLQEWVVDDGPSSHTPTQPHFDDVAPLIHLESPPSSHHTYPPLPGHAPASSISSFHSVSLSSDTDSSSLSSHFADSVSLGDSYEEVSTPSIITPATQRNISLDWERETARLKQVPPKLPQRPSTSLKTLPPPKRASTSSSAPGSPSVRASSGLSRKPPPPPPPPSRSSDRSSISSTSHSSPGRTTRSPNLKIKRPTPVPLAARARYDAVFNANMIQRRKAEKEKARERPALLSPEQARGAQRRAAGWRGLSVDLITGGQDVPVPAQDSEVVGPADRLEGYLVKTIWRRSRLGRRTLGEIWNECDPGGTGSLTRDQFAKGMWRIDEELRRVQVQALKSTSTGSLGSLRSSSNGRSPFKPPPVLRNKPILR